MTEAEAHIARSQATLGVIHRMEAALGAGSNDMAAHFHESFLWRGNHGCGTKRGLGEFRRNWQLPLRAAFADRVYRTEKFLADGDWAACFGHIEATHAGPFMGIPRHRPARHHPLNGFLARAGRAHRRQPGVGGPCLRAVPAWPRRVRRRRLGGVRPRRHHPAAPRQFPCMR